MGAACSSGAERPIESAAVPIESFSKCPLCEGKAGLDKYGPAPASSPNGYQACPLCSATGRVATSSKFEKCSKCRGLGAFDSLGPALFTEPGVQQCQECSGRGYIGRTSTPRRYTHAEPAGQAPENAPNSPKPAEAQGDQPDVAPGSSPVSTDAPIGDALASGSPADTPSPSESQEGPVFSEAAPDAPVSAAAPAEPQPPAEAISDPKPPPPEASAAEPDAVPSSAPSAAAEPPISARAPLPASQSVVMPTSPPLSPSKSLPPLRALSQSSLVAAASPPPSGRVSLRPLQPAASQLAAASLPLSPPPSRAAPLEAGTPGALVPEPAAGAPSSADTAKSADELPQTPKALPPLVRTNTADRLPPLIGSPGGSLRDVNSPGRALQSAASINNALPPLSARSSSQLPALASPTAAGSAAAPVDAVVATPAADAGAGN
eukprot:TRINITY_DN11344_c0_g1_i1.p1 TRINITY_DN11344_c0_g1~~TRINITY_DN11344_c0_g1_i1.p1  ORF type:complete len:434 (+),score=97.74 TRINITY_DN11344_c0_g1_i1:149-1450(+)